MDPRKAFASGTNETPRKFDKEPSPAPGTISDVTVEASRLQAEAMAGTVTATYRGAASLLSSVFRLIARWHHRRRTYDELMGCSDRLLEDIGLRRDQIAWVTKRHSAAASEILIAESELARRHLRAPEGDCPRTANDHRSVAAA